MRPPTSNPKLFLLPSSSSSSQCSGSHKPALKPLQLGPSLKYPCLRASCQSLPNASIKLVLVFKVTTACNSQSLLNEIGNVRYLQNQFIWVQNGDLEEAGVRQ